MKTALQAYMNENINVIMSGASGAMPGKLIGITLDWFEMETRWSSRQYFSFADLQSFWANKDKPKE